MNKQNIVLTGFMGTGKSTIGPLLAKHLNRPFVDLDDLIVERAGYDIPTIFARWGEAEFRQQERDALHHIAQQEGLVVATGGGTLIAAHNREVIAKTGTIICLTATPEAIEARLLSATGRPMLEAPDWQARMRTLLVQRMPAYTQIPLQVDTTERTVEEVVQIILCLLYE